MVDGQEVDDLTRFNGQPLHYVVDLSVFEDGGRIRAFTSRRELVDAVTDLRATRASADERLLRRDDLGLTA